MSEARRSRDTLMLAIALVLTPVLSGCNFDMGFPGGGVSVQGGPYGGSVNVGFPGGGVNVGVGPGGGGVSVAAPGFNMNLGFQRPPSYVPRTQAALFPPIGYQVPQPLPPIGQQLPPIGQPLPPIGQPLPPIGQPLPPIGQPLPPPPVAGKVLPFQGAPAPETLAGNAGEMVLLGQNANDSGLRTR